MKFNLKPKPKIGDEKRKKKFAFFPKKITDTCVIWLESYYSYYIYTNIFSDDTYIDGYWFETHRETLDFTNSSLPMKKDDDFEKRNKKISVILNSI